MARIARVVAPDFPHHIVQRGNRRQKVFFKDADYEDYLKLLDEQTCRFGVSIAAYCLMPNHIHLIATPSEESGLARAIGETHRKYTRMINFREKWRGYLWQGRHKRIPIIRDSHFIYIPYYIHLNPLDYDFPQWRTGDVTNTKNALDYLQNYRWSSYLDYIEEKNFRSVLFVDELSRILGSSRAQKDEIRNIITNSRIAAQGSVLE